MISFETVEGNQTSSEVLKQINSNFQKIKEGTVNSADYAFNADMVDGKQGSELIPCAATSIDTISSLGALTIGRYFCTQQAQSWEPSGISGQNSFILEVSSSASLGLKNYKLNYIKGNAANRSFYSSYKDSSFKWNEVITNKNLYNQKEVKSVYPYNLESASGQIVVYNNLRLYTEVGKKYFNEPIDANQYSFSPQMDISDSKRSNRYRIKWSSAASADADGTGKKQDLTITVEVYNYQGSPLKSASCTIEGLYPNDVSDTSKTYTWAKNNSLGQSIVLKNVIINKDSHDMIFSCVATFDSHNYSNYRGYGEQRLRDSQNTIFYYTAETNKLISVDATQWYYRDANNDSWNANIPAYWKNHTFGFIGLNKLSSYNYGECFCHIVLNDEGSAVVSSSNHSIISSNDYKYSFIQKDNYLYLYTTQNRRQINCLNITGNLGTVNTYSIAFDSPFSTYSFITFKIIDSFLYVLGTDKTNKVCQIKKISLTSAGTMEDSGVKSEVFSIVDSDFGSSYYGHCIICHENFLLVYDEYLTTEANKTGLVMIFNKDTLTKTSSYFLNRNNVQSIFKTQAKDSFSYKVGDDVAFARSIYYFGEDSQQILRNPIGLHTSTSNNCAIFKKDKDYYIMMDIVTGQELFKFAYPLLLEKESTVITYNSVLKKYFIGETELDDSYYEEYLIKSFKEG